MAMQVNEALSDQPAEKLEYSMRQEQEQVLRVGARIMACLARRAPALLPNPWVLCAPGTCPCNAAAASTPL
jgi:hypothetical protein